MGTIKLSVVQECMTQKCRRRKRHGKCCRFGRQSRREGEMSCDNSLWSKLLQRCSNAVAFQSLYICLVPTFHSRGPLALCAATIDAAALGLVKITSEAKV
jgi:hypothetical protein